MPGLTVGTPHVTDSPVEAFDAIETPDATVISNLCQSGISLRQYVKKAMCNMVKSPSESRSQLSC